MKSNFDLVKVEPKQGENVIVGQTHFIKTVDDLYETLASSSPTIKFGVAFNEASGDRLVRFDGNDSELMREAVELSRRIGAGHTFVVMLKDGYPINVLNRIKTVDEVVNIFVATSNSLSIVVYDDGGARGVLGVLDGKPPLGIERDSDKEKRHALLKRIGYKH